MRGLFNAIGIMFLLLTLIVCLVTVALMSGSVKAPDIFASPTAIPLPTERTNPTFTPTATPTETPTSPPPTWTPVGNQPEPTIAPT